MSEEKCWSLSLPSCRTFPDIPAWLVQFFGFSHNVDVLDRSDLRRDADRGVERLRREVEQLERERDRLRSENQRLMHELNLTPQPRNAMRRTGRRAGPRHGRHRHRSRPGRIDEVIALAVPTTCPHWAGAVTTTWVATRNQEDLPTIPPRVRPFDIGVVRCTACGRRVQGRHRLHTPNALVLAAVRLGPQAVALMVRPNKQLAFRMHKVARLLRKRFGLAVTARTVTLALHRAAREPRATFAALCEAIRGSPVVAPDETSLKVDGHPQWLWTFLRDARIHDSALAGLPAGRRNPRLRIPLVDSFKDNHA